MQKIAAVIQYIVNDCSVVMWDHRGCRPHIIRCRLSVLKDIILLATKYVRHVGVTSEVSHMAEQQQQHLSVALSCYSCKQVFTYVLWQNTVWTSRTCSVLRTCSWVFISFTWNIYY